MTLTTALEAPPAAPVRHPLSRDFVWRDAPSSPAFLSAEEVDAYNRDGFVVLRDVFTAAELAEVAAAIDPLEEINEQQLRDRGGQHMLSTADTITFTAHIVKRSETLRRFAAHPTYKRVCRDLIGEDVRLYWDQSVYKKTGKEQEFPWHQDNGYTFVEPQQYVTCWTPLVDVDEENGCPWIAPGLHRMGTLQHWRTPIGLKCLEAAPDAVAAPARAGDLVVFSSLAPHRTGPNLRKGSVRKAYILQYAPDGAEAVFADGVRTPQNDPERQFPILVKGA